MRRTHEGWESGMLSNILFDGFKGCHSESKAHLITHPCSSFKRGLKICDGNVNENISVKYNFALLY